MLAIPKIIDNQRKKLIDTLVAVSKNHEELSIATGYWDLKGTQLLLPHLMGYKKIRLLIGREFLIPRHQLSAIEFDYPDQDIFRDLERLKPESGLREIIIDLKKLIEANILEVKVFRRTFLHAKCYIFGNYDSPTAVGIIGSSNFTEKGLAGNFELNTGESDHRIVQFSPRDKEHEHGHLSWFDTAWNDELCVPWTGKFQELIDTSIHGELLFSPYLMYIKTLDFIYGERLQDDKEISPLSSKELQAFQARNVEQILWRLNKNGVAMLADSVGLGKTITAIGVMKQYTGRRIVVIAPKSLGGQWGLEVAKEGLLGVVVVSIQNANEIEEEQKKDKDLPISLFVIDESHNLRTHKSKRFDQIKDWIINNDNADTLLLTATPINNSIGDLTNQILIGTKGEQDLLKVHTRNTEGVIQSRSFYEALADIESKIKHSQKSGKDMKPIYREARQIIDPILREFVIRNTRQSIQKELGGKGMIINGKSYHFPKIEVSNINFVSGGYHSLQLSSAIASIENSPVETIQETMDKLLHPLRQLSAEANQDFHRDDKSIIYRLYQYILSLSFVPYRTIMYEHRFYEKSLSEIWDMSIKDTNTLKSLGRQIGMYGLLRVVLLKRFESSALALLNSVTKYRDRLEKFEDILKTKRVLLNLSEIDQLVEEFNEENIDDDGETSDKNIYQSAEKRGTKVSEATYNIKALLEDIEHEKNILENIIEMAKGFKQNDKKLETFKELVTQIAEQDPKKKILVFSFFSDTIHYLENTLQDKGLFTAGNSAFVSGRDRKHALDSADRFAPIARDGETLVEQQGEITYLFSTDVLAEGQNLQDCGLLINYDLHWNPIRMIQRGGRINRLGSTHTKIEIKNLPPHAELEQFLKLVQKLEDKISLISATIGTDASVLGEPINPIDYIGIYNQDSKLATDEYLKLEARAEVFTDDEHNEDLKDFYKTASDEMKRSLDKIPLEKWGIIDKQHILHAPEVTIFAKINKEEKANQEKEEEFAFYKTDRKGYALDMLLPREALQLLRSNDKTPYKDNISLDKQLLFEQVIKKVSHITPDQVEPRRLTSLEYSLIEDAKLAGWKPEDKENLERLLRTRNVFERRKIRQLSNFIKDSHKAGKSSIVKDTLKEIQQMLPDTINEPRQVTSIEPIFGFARDNQ